ncbi:MAG: DUF2934 domain-containing protein [Nitrospirota bacterium]|nr:DUF2934 domain-containing protein [Nitrospirota bacterium]
MKQQILKKKHRNMEAPDVNPSSQEAPVVDDLQACIAHRAFEFYEQEGYCHGHDLDHWLQAEQEILSSAQ